jgi:hypothetical protein
VLTVTAPLPCAARVTPPFAVGKSAFGSYLLWRAVQARRTVVYVSDKVNDAFIFHGDGRVEVFEPDEFKRRTYALRHLRSTVLIVDGIKPPVCDAFSVLITSPERERYKAYLEVDDACALYFPVLSRNEMRDMRVTCFPAVDEAGMWARYDRWGGIPRYVLRKLLVPDQEQIDLALRPLDLDRLGYLLLQQHSMSEADEVVSHRLFHLKPKGETGDGFEKSDQLESYFLHRAELGSPYIIDAVVAALHAKATSRLHELLGGSLDSNPALRATLSKLYGDVFERSALAALCTGGSFRCFDLAKREYVADVVLPACERIVFDSAAELGDAAAQRSEEQLENTVFVPRGSNYTSVDAVLPGRRPVNFTVNLKHDLKLQHATLREGVVPVMQALRLPSGSDIHFYWVLPHQRFEAARKDGIEPVMKGPAVVMAEFAARVVHFALLVDFPWPLKK